MEILIKIKPKFITFRFCFLNRLLNQYDGTLLFRNPILTNVYISISRFITVIPFIILKIRTKQVKGNYSKNKYKYELLYNDSSKEKITGKFGYIILSAIIYLFNSICFVVSFQIQTNSWIWILLIASLFYYLIFKVKLYKHHYLSTILIILIGIIIDLALNNLQNEIVNEPLLLIMKYLKEIFFSFYNVIAKYVMERKYVSVYEFSFYVGLINLVLLGIFSILDHYFFKLFDYKEYFNNFNGIEFLVMLGVISTQLAINLTSLFTIKDNSPCHVFMMFVFGQLAYYINLKGYSLLVIIGLVFIFFLTLIFNEIIQINCWGLSHNTKKNIIERANRESLLIIDDETIDSVDGNDQNIIELKEDEIYI